MEDTPPPKPSRQRERLDSESWLLDARVVERTVERVEVEAVIHDVVIVERPAVEKIIDGAEVVVDVVFSFWNPLTWIKVLLKVSVRAWRAYRARKGRPRPPKQMS